MNIAQLLVKSSNIAVVIFVVSSTFGVGLSLTVGQVLAPLRNARLITLALVANFVVAPAAALGIWKLLSLDEPLGIGLLLCGLAAGAPFLLKLAEFAKGNMAFAVGVMVMLMVLTVGYLPLVLPLLLAGTSVNPANIAKSLVILMLIPLVIGLTVRAYAAAVAGKIRPLIGLISTISMILVVTLTIAAHFKNVIGVFGTYGIFSAAIFTVICVAVGWLFGGPDRNTRGVLALGTAQRNTAAGFVVAGQNFSDPKVTVMIAVVMIVEFLMLVPLARFLARRQAKP